MGNSSRNGCYSRCQAPLGECCEENAADIISGFEGTSAVIVTEPSISAGKVLFPGFGAELSCEITGTPGDSLSSARDGFSPFEGREGRDGDVDLMLEDGSKYIGQFADGQPHGYGERWSDSEHYVGQWSRGYRDGEGQMTWPDGRMYRGQLQMGMFNGTGRMEWPTAQGTMAFEGEYANQLRHGAGRYIWSDGRVYTGTWARGKRWGKGTFTIMNGEQRQCVWKYSKLDAAPPFGKDGDSSLEATPQRDGTLETPQKEFTTATWDSGDSSPGADIEALPQAFTHVPTTNTSVSHANYAKVMRAQAKQDQQEALRVARQTVCRRASADCSPKSSSLPQKESDVNIQEVPKETRRHSTKSIESRASLDLQLSRGQSWEFEPASPGAKGSKEWKKGRKGTFKVELVLPDHRTITLQVSEKDTVDAIRQQLLRRDGLDVSAYVLTLRGERLSQGFTLGYYNIKQGDTIMTTMQQDLAFGYS